MPLTAVIDNLMAPGKTDASTALTAGANNNIVGDFNINATMEVASMRFNDVTPHTINISTSGTARTLTARGILMTPSCAGATIGGTATNSFIRPNHASTAGAAFEIWYFAEFRETVTTLDHFSLAGL